MATITYTLEPFETRTVIAPPTPELTSSIVELENGGYVVASKYRNDNPVANEVQLIGYSFDGTVLLEKTGLDGGQFSSPLGELGNGNIAYTLTEPGSVTSVFQAVGIADAVTGDFLYSVQIAESFYGRTVSSNKQIRELIPTDEDSFVALVSSSTRLFGFSITFVNDTFLVFVDGAAKSLPYFLGTPGGGDVFGADTTQLTNGNIVVAYHELFEDGDDADTLEDRKVGYQVLSPTGQQVAVPQFLDGTDARFSSVVPLFDGGFALVGTNVQNGDAEVRFFDADGQHRMSGGTFQTLAIEGTSDSKSDVEAVQLRNGMLAITYNETPPGFSTPLSLAALVDPIGVNLLAQNLPTLIPGGTDIDVTRLGPSDIAFVYSGTGSAVVDIQRFVRTTTGDDQPEILLGDSLSDTIIGLGGNDDLGGGDGDDWLMGGSGLDILVGGNGADKLHGGFQNDIAFYLGSGTGVTVDLFAGTGSGGEAEGDTLISVESVVGSTFDDILHGSNYANTLVGNAGNDILTGRELGDILVGGDGRDTAAYSDSTDTIAINLTNFSGAGGHAVGDQLVGIENVIGSQFGDLLRGDGEVNELAGRSGGDIILGEAGDDFIAGDAGGDVMNGGAGNDAFLFDNLSSELDIILDFDQNGNDTLIFTGFGAGFGFADFTISNVNDITNDGIDNGDAFLIASGWQGGVVLKNAFILVDTGDFVFV